MVAHAISKLWPPYGVVDADSRDVSPATGQIAEGVLKPRRRPVPVYGNSSTTPTTPTPAPAPAPASKDIGLSDMEFTNLILVPFILTTCFIHIDEKRTGTRMTVTNAFYQQRYIEHLSIGYSDEWPRSTLLPSAMVKKRVFIQLQSKFPNRSFEDMDTSWFIEGEAIDEVPK